MSMPNLYETMYCLKLAGAYVIAFALIGGISAYVVNRYEKSKRVKKIRR